MILAAPLVIPFAEAVGISIATLGMAKGADMVNDYIQENPEESAMILKTLVPNLGIGEIFMNKEKISLEDLDEMTDEEAADLPDEDKAELMKQAGKRKDRELSIATSEKIGLSGPGKEKIDIEREIDERVDPGGIQKEKKGYDFRDYIPKGAYKKRYADGGAIGIEVLFEEKNPRTNFFMGGPALEGQALNIYNSMNSYGFTDQQIADALQGQGLYTPSGSTPPETTAPNIINQQIQSGGGGGGGITTLDPLTRQTTPIDPNSFFGKIFNKIGGFKDSVFDKFSGSKVGEGITEGATKFKNIAFTPMMALANMRNPLNPSAQNYNPNLQKQMDFLEGQTGTRVFGTSDNLQFEDAAMIGRDPNSGLAKYGPGSVLSGQNVVSGFGTNDYEQQLANYISKMRTYKNLTNFQKEKLEQAKAEVAKEIARREQETADIARAANPGVYARADALGFTDGKGGGFASKSTGTNENFSNKTGRGRTGYSEGGLATMFVEKR